MYQLFIYLYQIGVFFYSFFNPKVKKMWKGERAAIRTLREKVDPDAKYIWFHAASLGEFEQGRPLMEHIRKAYPQYKILLTFFSPSGYEVRKDYEGADIITYLPIDTMGNARRFLRAVRPVAAFFIKYEFWFNYLHILKHRKVPVYSVSSIFRPGQIFFRWYGKNYAYVLRCFTHFFVQNEESKCLLEKIGIRNNVTVSGDTRFDRVMQIRQNAQQLSVIDSFVQYNIADDPDDDKVVYACAGFRQPSGIFVAGSSWQPDEEIFIRYFREHHLFGYGRWKMIIAPHVIDEAHLVQIERHLQGLNVLRYSQAKGDIATERADILIIDTFGLLSSIYQYATVTYIGGGFGEGIHNTLEAAVWGKPVIFGPNNSKFKEAQDLKQCGAAFEINDADSFNTVMQNLLSDTHALQQAGQNAEQYVRKNAQVTQHILNYLSDMLDNTDMKY